MEHLAMQLPLGNFGAISRSTSMSPSGRQPPLTTYHRLNHSSLISSLAAQRMSSPPLAGCQSDGGQAHQHITTDRYHWLLTEGGRQQLIIFHKFWCHVTGHVGFPWTCTWIPYSKLQILPRGGKCRAVPCFLHYRERLRCC